MLEELNVLNYALIEKVNLRFGKGLNVLSGETGAGKSILIGALGLLLGQKADISIIRTGTDEVFVSGILNISKNPEAMEWIKNHGISSEDGSIIIRRVVKRAGRGSIIIGSVPVTIAELKEFSTLLFDLHGQHEHQSLLKVENHRVLLDRYGNTEELCSRVAEIYTKLTEYKKQYESSVASERERLREIDLLKFAIKEIEEADLKTGEEEELENEHRILANHEKLFRLLENVYLNTSESRGGALSNLRICKNDMDELIQIDPKLAQFDNQFKDAFYEIEDFAENIREYKDSVEYDPERLTIVEERISKLRNLKKKYGDSIKEILDYCNTSKDTLLMYENWTDEKKKLEKNIEKLQQELDKDAGVLSEQRSKAALTLQKKVEEELSNLGMEKVKFRVLVRKRADNDITKYGMDNIEFVISTNPGEPFKRLRKIASGGELSRVMLAVKSILAQSDNINVLIFDEVDAGIGGEVAVAVGNKLKKLSIVKQIFCITHLATIAVYADNHFKVEKNVKDGRTLTYVERIKGDSVKREISRMLSGDKNNETALKHAEELLKKYRSTGL